MNERMNEKVKTKTH